MNGLCDSYCKVTLQPPVKNVSSAKIQSKADAFLQVNQQRTRTVAKNISPEYSSLLHFPGIEKADLTKLHMHIAILGTWKNVENLSRQEISFPDEDISGDHLLADARVSLVKIFPQMQKQFQVCLHKPTFKVGLMRMWITFASIQLEQTLDFESRF